MIKNKSHLLITTLLLLSGCQKKDPTISDLKVLGYEKVRCNNIGYHDTKSDLGEDPFFKIYENLEINNPELATLAARCFGNNNCIYELVENNEVVCQKFIITSNEGLLKTWEEHEVLVFNMKKVM